MHHLAASSANSDSKLHALDVLQRTSADMDALTPSLQTILHLAASERSTDAEFLSRLVLAVRETGAWDDQGRTPLHYLALSPVDAHWRDTADSAPDPLAGETSADAERLVELAEVLLRFSSSDPRDMDASGATAADLAASSGHSALAVRLRNAETRAARASRGCCSWLLQPAMLVVFVLLAHAAAAYYCLPWVPAAWPTCLLAALLACVVGFGLATALCDPGYLPKHAPPKRASPPPTPPSPSMPAPAAAVPPSPLPPPPSCDARNGPVGTPFDAAAATAAAARSTAAAQYCHSCRAPKPPRSKHCRTCDRCVAHFDHHCPWLGSCIGLRNRVPFYLFVSALVIDLHCLAALAIVTSIRARSVDAAVAALRALWRLVAGSALPDAAAPLSAPALAAAAPSPPPPLAPPPPSPSPTWLCEALQIVDWCDETPWRAATAHGFRIALAVLSLFVGVPLTMFWAHRTRNIVANLTTNERYNLRRYPHFKRPDGSFVNPFDRGLAGNCGFYFLAPCGCASKHVGAGQQRARVADNSWRQPLIDDALVTPSDHGLTAIKPVHRTSTTRASAADRV